MARASFMWGKHTYDADKAREYRARVKADKAARAALMARQDAIINTTWRRDDGVQFTFEESYVRQMHEDWRLAQWTQPVGASIRAEDDNIYTRIG